MSKGKILKSGPVIWNLSTTLRLKWHLRDNMSWTIWAFGLGELILYVSCFVIVIALKYNMLPYVEYVCSELSNNKDLCWRLAATPEIFNFNHNVNYFFLLNNKINHVSENRCYITRLWFSSHVIRFNVDTSNWCSKYTCTVSVHVIYYFR